jgi:hypothetical protein
VSPQKNSKTILKLPELPLSKLGYAAVGRGPKHPESPNLELQKEIDSSSNNILFYEKIRDILIFWNTILEQWLIGLKKN